MKELLALAGVLLAILFGFSKKKDARARAHARESKALDERAEREYLHASKTHEQVNELERRIQERTDDEPMEMDSPDSAAARLAREFGKP